MFTVNLIDPSCVDDSLCSPWWMLLMWFIYRIQKRLNNARLREYIQCELFDLWHYRIPIQICMIIRSVLDYAHDLIQDHLVDRLLRDLEVFLEMRLMYLNGISLGQLNHNTRNILHHLTYSITNLVGLLNYLLVFQVYLCVKLQGYLMTHLNRVLNLVNQVVLYQLELLRSLSKDKGHRLKELSESNQIKLNQYVKESITESLLERRKDHHHHQHNTHHHQYSTNEDNNNDDNDESSEDDDQSEDDEMVIPRDICDLIIEFNGYLNLDECKKLRMRMLRQKRAEESERKRVYLSQLDELDCPIISRHEFSNVLNRRKFILGMSRVYFDQTYDHSSSMIDNVRRWDTDGSGIDKVGIFNEDWCMVEYMIFVRQRLKNRIRISCLPRNVFIHGQWLSYLMFVKHVIPAFLWIYVWIMKWDLFSHY